VPGTRYCGSRGGSCGKHAHLFLHLPGAAPNEPGRATARRTFVAQPVGSLPQLSRRLSAGCQSLGLWWQHEACQLVGAVRGCGRRGGASSAILLRRPARSGRPKAVSEGRSGAEGSPWANTLAKLCWQGGGAQFRRRSRVGKALRKPLGFLLGWGVERPRAERTGSNWGRGVRDSPPSKIKRTKKSAGSLRQEEPSEKCDRAGGRDGEHELQSSRQGGDRNSLRSRWRACTLSP
jgi:hypothetical protein